MAYTDIDKPSDYFNTVLWTGNGVDDRSITGVGFQPDWVWLKQRNGTNYHTSFDVVRGATKRLFPNVNEAEDTNADSLQTFETDGFQVGTNGGVNGNTNTYASWNWLAGGTASSNTDGSITSSVSANTTSGFSIVSYTGTGSNATVGHGLGVAPKMFIVKNRSDSANWVVYNEVLGNTKALYLDLTDGSGTVGAWNNTSPTSSVFTVNDANALNGSSDNMIAYCFAEKKGYSKFDSYTGNGSTDGTFVYTGFKPAWVMTKISSGTGQWGIADNKRGVAPSGEFLFADSSGATNSASNNFDFLSNGFKARADYAAMNTSGATYIYMAFAENPFVSSTGVPATAR